MKEFTTPVQYTRRQKLLARRAYIGYMKVLLAQDRGRYGKDIFDLLEMQTEMEGIIIELYGSQALIEEI